MKARLSLLHKTATEWAKLSDFVPAAGELIVYDADDRVSYARIKIGDGDHKLHELDFIIDAAAEDVLKVNKYSEIADAGNIKEYFS